MHQPTSTGINTNGTDRQGTFCSFLKFDPGTKYRFTTSIFRRSNSFMRASFFIRIHSDRNTTHLPISFLFVGCRRHSTNQKSRSALRQWHMRFLQVLRMFCDFGSSASTIWSHKVIDSMLRATKERRKKKTFSGVKYALIKVHFDLGSWCCLTRWTVCRYSVHLKCAVSISIPDCLAMGLFSSPTRRFEVNTCEAHHQRERKDYDICFH